MAALPRPAHSVTYMFCCMKPSMNARSCIGTRQSRSGVMGANRTPETAKIMVDMSSVFFWPSKSYHCVSVVAY